MKSFAPVLFLASLAVPAASEPWTSDGIVNPKNLPTARVFIYDNATDGCWTNIGETRTYAEDKLENLGYEIQGEDGPAHVFFDVAILSNRIEGTCYGNIDVSLRSYAVLEYAEGNAIATIGAHGGIFRGYDNANYIVLDYVKELIDEMRNNAESPATNPKQHVSKEGIES